MKVTFKPRCFSKIQRSYIVDFAKWSGEKLMGRKMNRHIKISVQPISKYDYRKNLIYASTEINEDDKLRCPRNFIINLIPSFSISRTLLIFSHEMVHVKQFAIGELVWSNNSKDIWKGKKIPDNLEYWDLPYEIEAHGREKGLLYQWIDFKDFKNEPWTRRIF